MHVLCTFPVRPHGVRLYPNTKTTMKKKIYTHEYVHGRLRDIFQGKPVRTKYALHVYYFIPYGTFVRLLLYM